MVPMCFECGTVDPGALSACHIRFGYTIRLPFRLRINRLLRLKASATGLDAVCFLNEVPIADDLPHRGLHADYFTTQRKIWTDALVLSGPREGVSGGLLEAVRSWCEVKADVFIGPMKELREYQEEALTLLNRGIISYQQATGNVAGGELLRLLTSHDMQFRSRGTVVCVCDPKYALSDDDVHRIIRERIEDEVRSIPGTWGHIFDLPDIEVEKIQDIMLHQHEHIYYEFAFLARSNFVHAQYSIALLMAVVALESAHGTLLRHCIDRFLSDESKKASSKLLERLLREEGFKKVLPLSVAWCLDEGDRPTKERIDGCLEALELRNGIMHGLVNKEGPRVRQATKAKLERAYECVGDVFGCFSRALRRRGIGTSLVKISSEEES